VAGVRITWLRVGAGGAGTVTEDVSASVPEAFLAITWYLPGEVPALKEPLGSIAPPVAVHDTPTGAVDESLSFPAALKANVCPSETVAVSGETTIRTTFAGGATTTTTDVSLTDRFARAIPTTRNVPVRVAEKTPRVSTVPPEALQSKDTEVLSPFWVTPYPRNVTL
jgi:hypothetical protein